MDNMLPAFLRIIAIIVTCTFVFGFAVQHQALALEPCCAAVDCESDYYDNYWPCPDRPGCYVVCPAFEQVCDYECYGCPPSCEDVVLVPCSLDRNMDECEDDSMFCCPVDPPAGEYHIANCISLCICPL